jgi:hypothetical protein
MELAQNYFGDTRAGSLAGPVGGFIIAALAVTTILLIRNMNARLRRLPERFPEPPTDSTEDPGPGDREAPRARLTGSDGSPTGAGA